MDKVYILNRKNDKKGSPGSLIGQKNNDLFHITIEKKIEENQIHRYINQSFKYCTIKSNHTPLTALFSYGEIYSEYKNDKKNHNLIELSTTLGEFYPRIYRPYIEERDSSYLSANKIEKLREEVFQYSDYFPQDKKVLLSAVNQLAALKEMLILIFNTTHPSEKNLKVFGNNIKNLLVLSCIEVETQLKGIYRLHENSARSNYNTSNYYKLKDLMQLDKYDVKLPFYPDLKLISPFKKWTSSNPTKSLKWYDGYNAIKHNSEIDFDKASLENAISSICAVAVLIKAQYGNYIPFWDEKIGTFFEINNVSVWKNEDKILPPLTGKKWTSKKMGI